MLRRGLFVANADNHKINKQYYKPISFVCYSEQTKDRWHIMEWHLCHRSSCGSMLDSEDCWSLFAELDQVYEPYTIQPYGYASHAAILAGLAEALYGL